MTPDFPSRPIWDSGLSFGLHALLLVALNLTFISSPRVSVALGDSPMEVKLVAASANKNERSTTRRLVSDEGAVTLAKKEAAEESSTEESSQVGTISGNGGQTAANPNYFSNPAPVYPERARQLGQEGVVILLVEVLSNGTVKDLSVKESSGFSSLDLSAMRAVRQWIFEPARVGGVATDARVEVPVRFRLQKQASI